METHFYLEDEKPNIFQNFVSRKHNLDVAVKNEVPKEMIGPF